MWSKHLSAKRRHFCFHPTSGSALTLCSLVASRQSSQTSRDCDLAAQQAGRAVSPREPAVARCLVATCVLNGEGVPPLLRRGLGGQASSREQLGQRCSAAKKPSPPAMAIRLPCTSTCYESRWQRQILGRDLAPKTGELSNRNIHARLSCTRTVTASVITQMKEE